MSEDQEKPTENKWCPDCKRLIDVGCACGLSFREKALGQSMHTLQWSDTRK